MQLAVFGATGRTGVPLVQQALDRDHRVTALVRSASKAGTLLPTDDERLRLVTGDLLDAEAARTTVAGADAVLNVAGPVKGAPADLQQRAIGHVISAMHDAGIRRLVTLTGAGVRLPGDRPNLVDRGFGVALKLVQGKVLADSVAYVAKVRGSDLDWTIVRTPRLTDAEPRGSYRTASNVGGGTSTQIARPDLARMILDQLEDPSSFGTAPVVSW